MKKELINWISSEEFMYNPMKQNWENGNLEERLRDMEDIMKKFLSEDRKEYRCYLRNQWWEFYKNLLNKRHQTNQQI